MSDIVIRAEHLSKMYRLGVINNGTLWKDLQTWVAIKTGKEDPHSKIGEDKYAGDKDHFWALKDLNFEIKRGDRVGIIGKNGAGKSTLLKILSRITAPTEGRIKIKGKVASLLEVGTGFHGELTGRENIYLNGAILGMKKRQIDRKLDEIIDFSGIEHHIDTPVKRYSSGMYVRLAFAVAAHLDSDILIADEVLAVGDAEFQKKALGKMQDLSTGQGRTVLFVSHQLSNVVSLCNRGISLVNGKIDYIGDVYDVVENYSRSSSNSKPYERPFEAESNTSVINSVYTGRFVDGGVVENSIFFIDDDIFIRFKISLGDDEGYNLFCTILNESKLRIFSCESIGLKEDMILKIPGSFLVRGNYSLHCFIHKPRVEQVDVIEDVCRFSIIDHNSSFAIHGEYDYGFVFSQSVWL